MSPRPRPAYPPSLADWEDHRSTIKRLYVEEDRNLSEVQQILCQKFHFKASLRSYKNKLRAWSIRKYYKTGVPRTPSPAISLDPGFAARSSCSGERSPGLVKDEDDDESTSLSQVSSPAKTAAGEIIYRLDKSDSHTQDLQPAGRELVKRQLVSPDPLAGLIDFDDTTASIVMATKVFITTGPELETTNLAPSDASTRQIKPFRRRKNYIWHQFQHSLALLEQGNIHDAFEGLQKGCSMAERYLLRPNKQILMSLLIVMGNRRWSRHQQAWLSVLQFMASMCSKALGPRHPLTHIMIHIRSWDLMRGAAQPAIRVMMDTYSKQLGSGHPEVLLLKQGLSVELMREGDFVRSEALIQEACQLSGATHGQSSLARRNCLRRLGNLYVEQKRWDDAEEVFESIIALGSEASHDNAPTDETSIFTCQNLSLLNCRRGDMVKSEYWAEQEMDMALTIYGPEDEYYVDCLRRRTARLNDEPTEKWFSWLEVS